MIETTPDMTAKEVAEVFLQVTAKALLENDFDQFILAFHLPQVVTTHQNQVVISSREQFQGIFQELNDHYRSLGATELRRTCNAAEFRGADRIELTHSCEVYAGSTQVQPPYPVFSVMERHQGTWKIVSTDHDLADGSGLGKAFCSVGRAEDTAKAIYQDHLDVLTAAILRKDFATFLTRIQLPHRITTQTDIIDIRTPGDMQRTFAHFTAIFGEDGITEFVRIVTEASFVSPSEIIGQHESHQFRNGKRVVSPYPNRIRLVLGADDVWRETHCSNAILNTSDNYKHWVKVAQSPRLPDLNIDPERTPK